MRTQLLFTFLMLGLGLAAFAQPTPPPGSRQLDSLALIALYNSTDGPNWKNQTNWLDGPIDGWFGVLINQNNNRVAGLRLDNNNLRGDMSDSVALMGALTSMVIANNFLTGIPAGLAQIPNLDLLNCVGNRLTFDDLIPINQNFQNQFSYVPQQPVPPEGRITAYVGDLLQLSTPAENNTATQYQWFRLDPNGGLQPVQPAPTASPFYTIQQTSPADSGTYVCQITNPQLDNLTLRSMEKIVQVLAATAPRALGQITVGAGLPPNIQQLVDDFLAGVGAVKETCPCDSDLYIWQLPVPWQLEDTIFLTAESVEAGAKRGVPPNTDSSVKIDRNYPVNLGLNAPPSDAYRFDGTDLLPFNSPLVNTVVAVIDLGVDGTHPDIHPHIWTNPSPGAAADACLPEDLHGYNFGAGNSNAFIDSAAHGTHIAGLITTLLPGLPIEIMSLKVGDTQASIFKISCAMAYAIQKNVGVINVSMGYQGEESEMLSSVFDKAEANNIVVVTSAGNSSTSNDGTPHWPSNYAATRNNVLSVASVNASGNTLSSFSNFSATHVNIAAPGENIYSAIPGGGYGIKSGTSISNGFVTVLAAGIRAYNPGASAANVITNYLRQNEFSVSEATLLTQVQDGRRVKFSLINCAEKPFAQKDSIALQAGVIDTVINVRANDCYSIGILPTIETPPANGTASVDASGNILYTPNSGFTGTDQFSYRLTGSVDSATAEVVIQVTAGSPGGCTWWQILLMILLGLLAILGLVFLFFNNNP